MFEQGFGNFLEPEEFSRLRNEVAELRKDVENLERESVTTEKPETPDEIRIRDLQLLLVHLKEQNKRAKLILDQVLSQTKCERTVSAIPLPDEITGLSIQLFTRFTEEIE